MPAPKKAASRALVKAAPAGSLSLKEALGLARKEFAKTNPELVFDPKRIVERISSGCLIFDLVSGGGWPRARMSEVFGLEHSGKSALVYATMAALQKAGKRSVLIDSEHVFDPVYVKNTYDLEVDGDTFAVFQTMNIEEADALCDKFLSRLDRLDFLAFDSISGLQPKGVLESSLADDARLGAHARQVGRLVAKMNNLCLLRGVTIVFVNQMRNIITSGRAVDQSPGTGAGFNTKETYTTTGGNAPRYFFSLRMKTEFGGRITNELGVDQITGEPEKIRIGQLVKVINVKNKVGTPFRKGVATSLFPMPGQKGGWDNKQDLLHILKKRGRIVQTSSKFTYRGLHVPEWVSSGGKEASERKFMDSPELMRDAADLLRDLMRGPEAFDTLDVATTGVDIMGEELVEPTLAEVEDITGISDLGVAEDEEEPIEAAEELGM